MVTPYGGGHINDTYAAETIVPLEDGRAMRRFIIQRINTEVFAKPREVMSNIRKVTEQQRESILNSGGDASRECLTLVRTTDGAECLEREEDQTFWRCYCFVEGARTCEFIRDDAKGREMAYQAAKMFGDFHRQLSGLPGSELHETIPHFHHTPRRTRQLEEAIASDAAKRVSRCESEIEFARSLYPMASMLVDAMAGGELPVRVCHNDTKINNILFDFHSPADRAMTIIDLDTVMPGTMLYDFGDLVRTSTWPGAEDERDASKVYVSMDLFESLVKGWLAGAGDIMTASERTRLDIAGKIITYTIGIRFLADHLNGDKYFAIHRDGQNLDRARVQFAIIRDMDRQEKAMQEIVQRALDGCEQ